MCINERIGGVVATLVTAIALPFALTGQAHAAPNVRPAASGPCGNYSTNTLHSIEAKFLYSGSLRQEPATECASVVGDSYFPGNNVEVFCYVMNYYNNEWLYVLDDVGQQRGWISADGVAYNSGAVAPHC